MYQFLNCFPLGTSSKIIKRIKLMGRKAHRRSVSKASVFDETVNSKEVKLINYSNLNATIIAQVANGLNSGRDAIGEESLSRANSMVLDKIVEEEDKVNQLMENDAKRENDEEIADQILHELHVNSSIYRPLGASLSNQSCTLAKHVEDVTSQTDCFTNEIPNHTTIADSDSSQTVHFELNFEPITKLIDTQTIDEVDSFMINTAITNPLAKESLTDSSNVATTHKETTSQLISETNLSFEDTKRKNNKKLIQDTDLRTNAILNGVETWIELNKGSNCALGIDLIDRTINDRKLFIVHEIMERGIAETDHRLKIGDVILQVNEIPLKEMNCEKAIEHLNCTSGSVKLLVYRELICINDQSSNQSSTKSKCLKVNYSTQSTMQENERDENVEQKVINGRLYEIIRVDLHKKANKGLGICIVNDDRSPGPYIIEILPNSTAHLEGRLKKGDHIVNVNGENVSNRPINTILTMLKCLQGSISLKVARLMPGQVMTDEFNFIPHQPVEPKKLKFKMLALNPQENNPIKRKPISDRLKELIADAPKDTDSVGSFSLMSETVHDDWDTNLAIECEENSSICKNWVKLDQAKQMEENRLLNELLALNDCPNIDQLLGDNQIIEIDGQPLNDSNRENLISKLKRSASTVRMLVLN